MVHLLEHGFPEEAEMAAAATTLRVEAPAGGVRS